MSGKPQPRESRSITLGAVLAAVAVSAVLASNAMAVGGPVWVVKGTELAAESEKDALESEGGQFTLTGTTNIVCETVKGTGEIIGGNPGRALSALTFEKCHVEKKPNCLAANGTSEDSIQSESKSVLVYPREKPGSETEAYVAFTPDNTNTGENLFTEFTLKNALGSTECLLLNGFKVDVKATGTLIGDPSQINKECGVLARVGKLASGVFAGTAALEESVIGALSSSGSSESAVLWEPTKKVFSTIECKLEAFGAAGEMGVSDVTLTSKVTYGWNK